MSNIVRFSMSLNRRLLEPFDKVIVKKGYPSRSEAIRDLIRKYLVSEEWKKDKKETAGTITLVYDHETRELGEKLTHLQHKHLNLIISTTHIHLDKHNCLEVIIVRGKGDRIKTLADKLISLKGVKHGKLTMATTGRELK
mgnify:CR=1 FL=1